MAVIMADERKIPFFGGEPDHQDIFKGLKTRGYTEEDILGFYVVRQIPQWVRQLEDKKGLLEGKVPNFLGYYCRLFSTKSCPTLLEVKDWYKEKMGHELTAEVVNEDVAPLLDSSVFTQKISSDVGYIRNHFTLNVIQQLIAKYKKVAVVYGAGHFICLRNSFDVVLGLPAFIEDPTALLL